MTKNNKNIWEWYIKNPVVSIGLTIYTILQVLTFTGMINFDTIQKFTPAFFGMILLLISLDSVEKNKQIEYFGNSHNRHIEDLINNQNEQIEQLKDCHIKQLEDIKNAFFQGKIELIDDISGFFDKLVELIKKTSNVNIFHVSAHPLTILSRPQAELYMEKIDRLICNEYKSFLMRRLFIVDSQKKIDWIEELHEKYKDYQHTYCMRTIETQRNHTFLGYIIIDKRYSFLILPNPHASNIKVIFIESKTVSQVLLQRYDELWKLGKEVNDYHSD